MSSDTTVSQDTVEAILSDWPDDPTDVAHTVMEKYGAPNEATESRLIWFDNGPWKYSILSREGVSHEFPALHTDYLEQAIDYAVSPDRVDDLGQFDGSVTVRRTRGELSAECHGEPANFLALNLVHDILSGERTVGEARKAYTELYARKEAGGDPEYLRALQFDLPEGDQRDPDERTLTEEIEQRAEHQVH
jgi:hypothetical protein